MGGVGERGGGGVKGSLAGYVNMGFCADQYRDLTSHSKCSKSMPMTISMHGLTLTAISAAEMHYTT